MPQIEMTARSVAALKASPDRVDYWDTKVPGLALRIGPSSRTWIVRYRTGGRQRRLKLGAYPRVSLADARARARAKLAEVDGGSDPAEERQISRAGTFQALTEEVVKAKSGQWRERTRRERQRIINAELLPVWGTRASTGITRRDVVQLVEQIGQRAPVMANRTLATIRMLFNEAIDREFPGIEGKNPAYRLKPLPENGRDRYLDKNEIKAVWKATEEEPLVTRGVFRVALLTAQRVENVRAMRWDAIDQADVWHIAETQFKGRREHLVPLSSEVLEVLDGLRAIGNEYVFPGRGDGKKPHTTSTNSALRRVRARTDIPSWTVHDFRTTFRTHATRARDPDDPRDPAGFGVAPNVADAVLGHREASLGFGRYTGDASRYLLSEKRQALKLWGAFVLRAAEENEIDEANRKSISVF